MRKFPPGEIGTRLRTSQLNASSPTTKSSQRSAELGEIAIELFEGRPGGSFDIAGSLLPEGGLRFSRLFKAEGGYLLAEEGRIDWPLAPRNALDIVLNPDQIAELAARDILRECFDQIAANVTVVRQLDDPEGPHQMRIGLRRLRSVFDACASVLQSPELARLDDEARWLGREVGNLRDLDVVANDIVLREATIHADELGLSALSRALLLNAGDLREQLRKALLGPRAQAFLIDLARFVETRGWLLMDDFEQTGRLAQPVGEFATTALDKCWKKVGKRARGLKALTVEQRHELRKELKKLRYTAEFFSSLYPAKRVVPFLKRLKKLQTVFGDLNDAAIVKIALAKADVPGADTPAAQRAIGWVLGASQARADCGWAGAKSLWRKLEETRFFWR